MKRQKVQSSNLASIGYDATSKTLEIEFNNGDIYEYYNVPQSIHNSLMNASSHGTYFSANIRNSYRYKKF
jgi:hypothetical protein